MVVVPVCSVKILLQIFQEGGLAGQEDRWAVGAAASSMCLPSELQDVTGVLPKADPRGVKPLLEEGWGLQAM